VSRRARLVAPSLTLVTLVILFSLTTDRFMTTVNLQNILSQTAPIAIAATGATFVILCAEIDLSIGTLSVFIGVLAACFWTGTWWVDIGYWGIPAALLVGAAIGYFNGVCVAWIGIPSFMMTLAMLTIAQGLAIYVTKSQPIFNIPGLLKYIGGSGHKVGGIPVIAVVAIVVLLIGEIVLSYTRFGRYVYMTGGNREAAEMSGVNTRQVVAVSLMISGLTAGIAGLVSVGRLGSANPSASSELLITTIAAVVLGGTSLFGGEGGIKNTVLGLLIFGVVSNGLNLLPDISIYFKQALQGIILVGALLLNVLALRLERVQNRTE
jgi:ribose transport system permease protein